MRIVDIETIRVATGLEPGNSSLRRTWTVMRVRTDEGLEGIGRGGSTVEGVIQEHLRLLLMGKDPLRVESLWEEMYQASHSLRIYPKSRYVAAMGAVDVALWDIRGKAMGLPIYKLLGGFRDRVPAYGDPIWCTPGEEAKAAEDVEAVLAEGFTALKIHLWPGDFSAAVELVRQVRRAMGDGVKLGLDLFQRWDPWTAIELARECAELDIAWLEEPALWDDQVRGLALVASAIRVPVSAGEAECTLWGCRDLMERGGVKIIQPDIIGAGGFTQVARISHLAAAFHVWSAPHGASFPEFNAHMVAAHPNGLSLYLPAGLTPPSLDPDLPGADGAGG